MAAHERLRRSVRLLTATSGSGSLASSNMDSLRQRLHDVVEHARPPAFASSPNVVSPPLAIDDPVAGTVTDTNRASVHSSPNPGREPDLESLAAAASALRNLADEAHAAYGIPPSIPPGEPIREAIRDLRDLIDESESLDSADTDSADALDPAAIRRDLDAIFHAPVDTDDAAAESLDAHDPFAHAPDRSPGEFDSIDAVSAMNANDALDAASLDDLQDDFHDDDASDHAADIDHFGDAGDTAFDETFGSPTGTHAAAPESSTDADAITSFSNAGDPAHDAALDDVDRVLADDVESLLDGSYEAVRAVLDDVFDDAPVAAAALDSLDPVEALASGSLVSDEDFDALDLTDEDLAAFAMDDDFDLGAASGGSSEESRDDAVAGTDLVEPDATRATEPHDADAAPAAPGDATPEPPAMISIPAASPPAENTAGAAGSPTDIPAPAPVFDDEDDDNVTIDPATGELIYADESDADAVSDDESQDAVVTRPLLLRVLEAIHAPLDRLSPGLRSAVDLLALSLAFWVPLVWIFVFVFA